MSTDAERIMQARPGDTVRAKWSSLNGAKHPFEGEAWASSSGALFVGRSLVRYRDGFCVSGITDIEVIPKAWPEGTVLSLYPSGMQVAHIDIHGDVCRCGTTDLLTQTEFRDDYPDAVVLRLGYGDE